MTVVRCVSCGLRQFALISVCRRCRADLGFSLVEIPLVYDPSSFKSPAGANLSFGSALRTIRRKRGKSQARVAELALTARSHISRIECNAAMPNLSTLLRILGVLGVESLYFRIKEKSS
jgi:DNA-binding XRE family transcriptional regulator